MTFSPQLFLSNIKAKDGLARPARFEVVLPIPTYINNFISQSIFEKIANLPTTIITNVTDSINQALGKNGPQNEQSKTSNPSISRYLALQCEAAELPGKTILTQDARVYGPGYKVPYLAQYGDTTLTFLCTNEFYERKLFERWMEAIAPSDTNNLRYAKGQKTRYLTNIKIIQYDDFIKRIFAVELIDAFPIGIASQSLSWSEDNFHRLSVQFAYQKYNVIYEGSYDLVAAATDYFGAKGARIFDKAGQQVNNSIGNVLNRIF
jgi:hypothetical protein